MSIFSRFFQGVDKPSKEPGVQAYLEHAGTGIARNTLIREIPFVVLDTETTGLDPGKDAILSMAGFYVSGFAIDLSDRFEALVNREAYLPRESVEVHGILAKHTRHGISEREALLAFLAFIKGSVLVGHHIAFDRLMLNRSLENQFGIRLKNKVLDTAQLASRIERPVLDKAGPESLDTLCKRYKISPLARHTAPGDAYMTALLFLKLLGRLEKRGVDTYRKLVR